jgi:hypothetical protein
VSGQAGSVELGTFPAVSDNDILDTEFSQAISVIASGLVPAIHEIPYLRRPAVACRPGELSAVGDPTANEQKEYALWQL